MTPDEREAEFRGLEYCEVPFELIHGRIEQLAGRPVWTHEMGTSNFESLATQCRWENRPATMAEIVELIPEEKRIILGAPEPVT